MELVKRRREVVDVQITLSELEARSLRRFLDRSGSLGTKDQYNADQYETAHRVGDLLRNRGI